MKKNLNTNIGKIRQSIMHLLSFTFFSLIMFPALSLAQNSRGIVNPLGADASLESFFAKVMQGVVILGASVVVFFFIYAGFKYVIARGDEDKIKDATQTLTWTAVGAAVLLGAQVLQTVISNTVQQLGK